MSKIVHIQANMFVCMKSSIKVRIYGDQINGIVLIIDFSQNISDYNIKFWWFQLLNLFAL